MDYQPELNKLNKEQQNKIQYQCECGTMYNLPKSKFRAGEPFKCPAYGVAGSLPGLSFKDGYAFQRANRFVLVSFVAMWVMFLTFVVGIFLIVYGGSSEEETGTIFCVVAGPGMTLCGVSALAVYLKEGRK